MGTYEVTTEDGVYQIDTEDGPSSPSLLQELGSSVLNSPKAALEMVKSVPSGLSNILNSVISPKESLNNGTLERTARGIGTLGAGAAGAGAGAMAGAPLAPFTFGASVPIGAAIGGAAGLLGFDWANQATGSDAPTTPEEDVRNLVRNTGTGLGMGAIAKVAEVPIKAAAKSLPSLANALDRSSLGTKQSDYGKASETRTVEGPDGTPETFVKASLNDLLENNELGTSRNPAKISKILDTKAGELASTIDDVIKNYDSGGNPPAEPDFSGALDYLYSGKVPADLVPSYVERLSNLDAAIRKMGKGSLEYLNEQKKALGKSYDPADKVLSGFNRAIYHDLKASIETYAPEVGPLNQELAKYVVTEPIVNRALKAKENASPLKKLANIGFTTGGIGAPTIAGSIVGGPLGGLLGAVLGLTGKAASSPTGQAIIAKGLRGVADIAEPIASNPEALMGAAVGAAEATNRDTPLSNLLNKTVGSQSAASLKSNIDRVLPKKEATMGAEKVPAALLEQIKKDPVDHAIMLMESSGDPDAKNKDSSASGLFQLVSKTAKNLGVKDVFDPQQNYDAYKKLKESTIKKFGADDVYTIYASHYLGEPTLEKLLNREPLTPEQQDQVEYLKTTLFPKLRDIYMGVLKV